MNKNPLVSVIVPIYGVEPYIEKCARSLFEQSLENMEFIYSGFSVTLFSLYMIMRLQDALSFT